VDVEVAGDGMPHWMRSSAHEEQQSARPDSSRPLYEFAPSTENGVQTLL
jgi:hypothetical protein